MSSTLPPPAHPPVHRHSHHHAAPHRSSSRPSSRPGNPRRLSAPSTNNPHAASTAASPEVISSLVDQLSRLSPSPLQNPALYGSLAPSPDDPTFPSRGLVHDIEYEYTGRDGFLHPDDAALPPVVRTSKPPSGYSSYKAAGDSEHHSRRSSGISVGKGGVDIPSYVRNYMNRAAGLEGQDSHRSSRESSLTGKSARRDQQRETDRSRGRLSGSSRERMRSVSDERSRSNKSREKEAVEDLHASAAGVLSTSGDATRVIPDRRSSWGKGSSPSHSVTYKRAAPAPLVTTDAPLHMSPMGSPRLPSPEEAIAEDATDDEAAPPPELHRSRTDRKRSSKTFPKRSDSLPIPSPKSPKSQKKHSLTPSSPRKAYRNRNSEPHFAANPHSPPRPSFASAPETRPIDLDHQRRPSSADSIEDAVDAYLCSPRLSQKIRMPGSTRTISFSEVGDPAGFAVFVCVGMGLTRYVTAFYDELALTLGLRLITPDRPGVGESDPIDESERTVLTWPDDVLYICQALKITKFSIMAHSAGAIYALATALRMPGHIRGKIHLLAPWIPPSQMQATTTFPNGDSAGGKTATVPTSQRILRALPTPILKAANSSFVSATSSSLTTSLPRTKASKKRASERREKQLAAAPTPAPAADDEEMQQPVLSPEDIAAAEKERQSSYDERLTSAIWVLSTRNANPAVDLLVCLERMRPVGFRYVDITRAVVIHHGAKDTRVPVQNVEWLGRAMRRCEVRVLREEGHGLMASARVMGEVLDEIATEWRDWRKVVEGREIDGGGRERQWAE